MPQDASQGSSCCWYYSPRLPRRHAASFSPAFSIATSEGLAVAIVGLSANVSECTDRAPPMSGNGAGHYGEGYGGDGNDSRHPCRTPQTKKATTSGLLCLERVMGIEPTLAAWEAAVLPLNYTRVLPYQRFPSLVMGMTRDIRVARPSGAPTLRFGVQIGSPADLSSPTLAAWEAAVLPLNYTRRIFWC